MQKKYIYIFLLLIKASAFFSQQKWYGKFGWWGVDIGNDVVETFDGNYMVTGLTSSFTYGNTDVLIAALNKNGGWNMWTKNVGGINNDIGQAIVKTYDSAYVIAGYTNSFGNGGYDGYLIKINKNGNVIWQKTFGGSDWDFFYSVQCTSDSGYVMAGYSYSGSKGGKDIWIVKTDSVGNIQWEKKIGGIYDDEAVSIEILTDKRIACFGTTYSFSDIKGNYFIYKTNNNGDSLFFKDFGYSNLQDVGYDFFQRPTDQVFVIAGSSQSPFGTDTMYYHQLLVDSLCNWIGDIKETKNNLKVQIAYTNAWFNNNKHYVVYDLYGIGQGKHEAGFYLFSNQYWLTGTTYGSSEDDVIYSCKKTSDKGVIGVGYTTGFYSLQEDVFVVKTDSNIFNAIKVVGVEELKDKISLNIYPNPVQRYIYIDGMSNKDAEVVISDLQGREMFRQKQEAGGGIPLKIDVSWLETGMYIINIFIEENKFTGKFLKQ